MVWEFKRSSKTFTAFLCLKLAALVCAGIASCKEDKGARSTPKSFVTVSQVEEAFEIVRAAVDLDYLPFKYKEDGCYARAYFLSMELAAHKIPSSGVYVVGNLNPEPGISWGFHVAPLLIVNKTNTYEDKIENRVVIDPSLFEKPVPFETWIKKLNVSEGNQKQFIAPGSIHDYYTANIANRPQPGNSIVRDFESMPKFKSEGVSSYCSFLGKYISLEAGNEERAAAKQERLIKRVGELVRRMEELDKFSWYAPENKEMFEEDPSHLCLARIKATKPSPAPTESRLPTLPSLSGQTPRK